ncbi:hypothetical protein LUW77_18735 [Streptomyces radiopugnans]|nr:hypothetical protein LUW77_18735 [Streptomyces radiopugnans]
MPDRVVWLPLNSTGAKRPGRPGHRARPKLVKLSAAPATAPAAAGPEETKGVEA